MRWVEALQAATRPIVTLALVGALVYGFVTTLVNAEGVLSVVGMGVAFLFSQRQMGRAEGTLPPTVAPRQEKPLATELARRASSGAVPASLGATYESVAPRPECAHARRLRDLRRHDERQPRAGRAPARRRQGAVRPRLDAARPGVRGQDARPGNLREPGRRAEGGGAGRAGGAARAPGAAPQLTPPGAAP